MQDDAGAGAGRGHHGQRPFEGRGSASEVPESVTLRRDAGVEALAVVAHLEPQDTVLDRQRDEGFGARRVSDDVGDGFLEYQKDFATDVRTELGLLVECRQLEAERR